jgi:Domain of unknown function (DUF222)
MFEDNAPVDPAVVFPTLTAAITAVTRERPVRGGSAIEAGMRAQAALTLARQVQSWALGFVACLDDQGMAPALGSPSTGAWLAAQAHLDGPTARALVLAARVADRLPALGAMLASGEIGVEHVQAVAFGALRVPPELLTAADTTFAELAASARPSELRQAGKHLAACYDTEAVDRDANHVRDSRYLTLGTTFRGAVHLEGLLTAEGGAILQAVLESNMAKNGPEDDRTLTQRRADALVTSMELAQRSGDLPDCGGDRPRITFLVGEGRSLIREFTDNLRDSLHDVTGAITSIGAGQRFAATTITNPPDAGATAAGATAAGATFAGMTLESFAFGNGKANLLGSTAMLANETIARICCDADLNIAAIDPAGEILNYGRTRRFPSPGQRRALVIRDRGCVFPGCDRPPSWCQAHHLHFWGKLGHTNLVNLALVCSFHHHTVHEDQWTLQRQPPDSDHPEGGWTATAPNGYQLTQHRRPAA